MNILQALRNLFGKKELIELSVLGVHIQIPSNLPDERHNQVIAYTELVEHLNRSTEAYVQARSALKSYQPSSHSRPVIPEPQDTVLLENHLKKHAEFVEVRKQFIELFEPLQPWLAEQEQLPNNAGAYAGLLLKLGTNVLKKVKEAQHIYLVSENTGKRQKYN